MTIKIMDSDNHDGMNGHLRIFGNKHELNLAESFTMWRNNTNVGTEGLFESTLVE